MVLIIHHDTLHALATLHAWAFEGVAIFIGEEATHFFFGAVFLLAARCFLGAACSARIAAAALARRPVPILSAVCAPSTP